MVKFLFSLLLISMSACTPNTTTEGVILSESIGKGNNKKALDTLYYEGAFYQVEIVEEKTAIDSQLTYVGYSIYEYNMNGDWMAIVEAEVKELLSYKSYFLLGNDTLYIESCYEHDLATYNIELLETISMEDKYHIRYFHDCEACAHPTEYTIAIEYKKTPKIYYVGKRLANYSEEDL